MHYDIEYHGIYLHIHKSSYKMASWLHLNLHLTKQNCISVTDWGTKAIKASPMD